MNIINSEDEEDEADFFGQELVHQVLSPLGWKRSEHHPWLWDKWIPHKLGYPNQKFSIALSLYDSQEGWFQLLGKRPGEFHRPIQDRPQNKFFLTSPDILDEIQAWVESFLS